MESTIHNGIKFFVFTKKNGRKYYQRQSYNGGQYLHRVIWSEHFGEIPKGMHVHHINNDSLDNRIENLELIDSKDHFLKHHDPVESGRKGGKRGTGKAKRRSDAHYKRMVRARLRKLRGHKPQE